MRTSPEAPEREGGQHASAPARAQKTTSASAEISDLVNSMSTG